MLRRLAGLWTLRTVARDLTRIAAALDTQNTLLARLADRLAPVDPPTDRVEVRADTGVSTFDPIEAVLADDFITRTYRATGHIPDDEEVLIYLADEKTTDLHQRLIARDQELARLAESRA
jgi:hypothetical protein